MSAWLRHVTTVVLLTLASVCAGVSTPAWETKTAHRGFVAAAAVAASEIASVTPSRVKEKSVLSGKGTVSSPVYTFDDVNRLKTVKPSTSSVPIATYGYDGVGNRESVTHDNGIVTSYAYNRRNRLTGIQHKLGATLLLGVAYTLDASGLRTAITETGQIERTVSYGYDGVKRLTSETVTQLGNDRRTSWTYDRTGNRLTQTKSLGPVGSPTGTASTAYVYDANDRLETEAVTLSGTVPGAVAGTTTYTYDNAGNTTRKVSPTETIDYVYDDANRLAEIQTLAGEVTRYAYGHDGIRLSQTTNATAPTAKTTHYLIDPNQPYAQVIEEAEQVGSGALSVKALYAVGDDRIRRYTPAVAANGSNPGVPAGLRYYHADGLGSTRLLTDEAGAVTDRTTFEAFGEIDAAASQQTSDNAFLYTGEQLDPNSGFYYLRARYMNPVSGRFTQQDSFAGFDTDPMSINKYIYGNQDPARVTDPSGNFGLAELSVASGIQSILAAGLDLSKPAIAKSISSDQYLNTLSFYHATRWGIANVRITSAGKYSFIKISGVVKGLGDVSASEVDNFIVHVKRRWGGSFAGPGGNVFLFETNLVSDMSSPSGAGTLRLRRSRLSGQSGTGCRAHAENIDNGEGDDLYVCGNRDSASDTSAHEFGHSLGFRDMYVEKTGAPIGGHEEDIMATISGRGSVQWYHGKVLNDVLGK